AHWLARWREEGRPRTVRDWLKPAGTVAVTGASTFLWPSIAWLATGERDAFFASQEAWRQTAHDSFLSASVLGQALESPLLMAVAVGMLALFLFLALRHPAGRWGAELRGWVAVYPAYIMLATQPTMSVFRYLMFALVPWWPLPEAGEGPEESDASKVLRWGLLVLVISCGVVLQYFWVTRVYSVDLSPTLQAFP
ncbi:MAG TPA: hypothetical protein VF012_10620, partial [Nocardioidaceae bacterium]